MYRQIITPANKEDLNVIIHLPDNYISKKVEIIAFEVGEPEDDIPNE